MKFARWVFLIAGIYGVLILVPGYFLETLYGELSPPPLNHPEFYYGFHGVALAWQIVYFMISRDPMRYRPLMLIGALGKFSFLGSCIALFLGGRLAPNGAFYGSLGDGIFAVLFLIAYRRTSATRLA